MASYQRCGGYSEANGIFWTPEADRADIIISFCGWPAHEPLRRRPSSQSFISPHSAHFQNAAPQRSTPPMRNKQAGQLGCRAHPWAESGTDHGHARVATTKTDHPPDRGLRRRAHVNGIIQHSHKCLYLVGGGWFDCFDPDPSGVQDQVVTRFPAVHGAVLQVHADRYR
jgi:hypothetical protein